MKRAFVGWNRDNSIRINSSSGGVFNSLAVYVLNHEGVVYGVRFNNSFHVEHDGITRIEDLYQIRGSKYIQSENTKFDEVKRVLQSNRLVLYTGTPCQIAGLIAFLDQDYSNLITLDIICHGVPSSKAFDSYREFLEKYHKSRIISFNFRYKDNSWEKFCIKAVFDNHSEYKCVFGRDMFGAFFNDSVFIRPSCYNCKFKGEEHRASNITLGDAWGIGRFLPNHDDIGASIVICNDEKGDRLLQEVIENLIFKDDIPFSEMLWQNSYYYTSVKKPNYRNKAFEMLSERNFEYIFVKLIKPTFLRRVIKKIRSILKINEFDSFENFDLPKFNNDSDKNFKFMYTISEDCCGCFACVNACNHQAISVKKDFEGFLYPVINSDICVECNLCKKVCPIQKFYYKNTQ